MGPGFGLLQVEDGPSGQNVLLMLQVFFQHLIEGQQLRLSIDQGDHNHAEAVLHLGVLV